MGGRGRQQHAHKMSASGPPAQRDDTQRGAAEPHRPVSACPATSPEPRKHHGQCAADGEEMRGCGGVMPCESTHPRMSRALLRSVQAEVQLLLDPAYLAVKAMVSVPWATTNASSSEANKARNQNISCDHELPRHTATAPLPDAAARPAVSAHTHPAHSHRGVRPTDAPAAARHCKRVG